MWFEAAQGETNERGEGNYLVKKIYFDTKYGEKIKNTSFSKYFLRHFSNLTRVTTIRLPIIQNFIFILVAI